MAYIMLYSSRFLIARPKPPAAMEVETYSARSPLPEPSSLKSETKIRRVSRGFATSQLRESGHLNLANRLDEETETILPYSEPMNDVGEALLPLVEKVSTDRFEELESMCERASVSQYNARSRFRRILDGMSFSPEATWNDLVTIIAFTGHVAVHCANLNMEEQSVEVVDEADKFLHEKLPPWIIARAVEVSSCGYCSKTQSLH